MQCPEIAVKNLGRDLVAGLYFLQDVLFVGHVHHRHGTHPAFDLFTVHGKSLRICVDFLDFTLERILLLCGRRGLVLLGIAK